MAKTTQKTRTVTEKASAPVAEVPATDPKQALKDELDALLDEVDEVLEQNAEAFVRDYIQKGGQ